MPSRKVPVALREPLKNELDRLVKSEVLAPVDEPTQWVNQMVIVPKKDGSIRLCLDPRELNKVLMREHFTLPTLDDTLHEIGTSKVFSKVDLSSGYWHVKLEENASYLTTFQTCHGRYRFLRLPFGLSVSSEIFQKKLISAIGNLEGIICVADDVIIHGRDEGEHDERMKLFLNKCSNVGIKLNKNKIHLKVDSVSFMGHKISKHGLSIDDEKVKAIREYPEPQNISELRSFLGLINFVSKFVPNCVEILHPLNNLLKKNVPFIWSEAQIKAFNEIKRKISEAVLLNFYDPNKKLFMENDASEYGVGSAIFQNGVPIAFASRSLSETQRNWAQIEKELYAVVYGLEKFHNYVFGRKVYIYTDHLPLISISKKPLLKAPKRLQSMLLKIQEYDYELIYKAGKSIPVADALSRAPVEKSQEFEKVQNLTHSSINDVVIQELKVETEKDPILSELKCTISQGWPQEKCDLSPVVTPYFDYRDELVIEDGIILRGDRLIIPLSLRSKMKSKIHAGHAGINSCLRRARQYLFWPGMSQEIRQYVESCITCSSLPRKQSPLPLILHDVPDRPWQKVGTDIFTIKSRNYLVTTDYFSQYCEIDFLPDTLSQTVIHKLKSNFARHGVPDVMISDNGPQFSSAEFQKFVKNWNLKHKTISPGNSQANGAAEAAVKVAKNLLKKCHLNNEDPYIGLLNLRNTPQEDSPYTPVQRLMGRHTKTLIPTSSKLLVPNYARDYKFIKENSKAKIAERNLNRRELKELRTDDKVRVQPLGNSFTKSPWKEAVVQEKISPRSYIVRTEDGTKIRRDRGHLILQKDQSGVASDKSSSQPTIGLGTEASQSKSPPKPPKVLKPKSPAKRKQPIDENPRPYVNKPSLQQAEPSPNVTTNESPKMVTRSGRAVKKPLRYT